MVLDHLVVSKMGSKGETLLKAGELDDILRFGSEELFSNDQAEDKEIQYDDETVNKLLDRSQLADDEETDHAQNDFLQHFKVATFVANLESKPSEDSSKPSEDSSTYWERLLKDKWEEYCKEQQDSAKTTLGKGKRMRNKVVYTEDLCLEDALSDEEWEQDFPTDDSGSEEDPAIVPQPPQPEGKPKKKKKDKGRCLFSEVIDFSSDSDGRGGQESPSAWIWM